MMTEQDALKQGEQLLRFRERLRAIHCNLEAIVDICTREQRDIEKLIDEPPPYRPSNPLAKAILLRSESKELEIERKSWTDDEEMLACEARDANEDEGDK
jgi:hypothetical protein